MDFEREVIWPIITRTLKEVISKEEAQAKRLIPLVQAALTPDLLRGRWRKQTMPLDGHCYVAAEALFHLLGKSSWKAMCASYRDEGGKATHWWLTHCMSGFIADPTAEQYAPDTPPYHLGRGSGFMTTRPSKRAKIVIARVKKALK